MKQKRGEVMKGEPLTKPVSTLKHNVSSESCVKKEKVKNRSESVQPVSTFMNSYVSFIKNKIQNNAIDITPELMGRTFDQPCISEINHLKSLKNRDFSESVNGTNYLTTRKKKKCDNIRGTSRLGKVVCCASSPEKVGSVEVINISTSSQQSSSPSETSLSTENIASPFPPKNRVRKKSNVTKMSVDENINDELFACDGEHAVPVKSRNKTLGMFSPMTNLREKKNAMEMNSEHIAPLKTKSRVQKQTNSNVIIDKAPENNSYVLSPSHKRKKNNQKESDESKRSLGKEFDTDLVEFGKEWPVSNARMNEMIEEINPENSTSPSKKKDKQQKNNSPVHKCEDSMSLLTLSRKRKKEQLHTNRTSKQIIEDIDTDCFGVSIGPPSSGTMRGMKEDISCECSVLNSKKKKKMQTERNRNGTDCCVFEHSSSLQSSSPKSDGKRKKKHKHTNQNKSNISHEEDINIDLFSSGRELPFDVTNGISKKKNLEEFFLTSKKKKKKKKEKKIYVTIPKEFPSMLPSLSCNGTKEVHKNQNEPNINRDGSLNTDLFATESQTFPSSIGENAVGQEINSESPVSTTKKKKIQRQASCNATDHNVFKNGQHTSLLYPSPKRRKKHKHTNQIESYINHDENFNTDLLVSEIELPSSNVKVNGTSKETNPELSLIISQNKKKTMKKQVNRITAVHNESLTSLEEEINESSMIKLKKKKKVHQRTNNSTICYESENSPTSVFQFSSYEEDEQHINMNLNEPNVNFVDNSNFDLFSSDSELISTPPVDLLTLYANKLGSTKQDCDKLWNDAVLAKADISYSKKTLGDIDVIISHDIPPLHVIDIPTCRIPKTEDKENLAALGMKQTPFNKSEDSIILKNWQKICEDNDISHSTVDLKQIGRHVQRKQILQYLGNGLPDRALYQIYNRLVLLRCSQKGQFTVEEDYLVLKSMCSDVPEKYSLLSLILKRSRNSVYKRYKMLRESPRDTITEHQERNKWTMEFAEKVVKSLMHFSGASSIDNFENAVISSDIWRRVANDINVAHWKLRQFWSYKLHVQLFAKTPIYEKQVQYKIMKWLHQKNYSTEKDIQWSESLHLVSGSTPWFMWLQFRKIRERAKFKQFKIFRDFIDMVHAERSVFEGESRYLTRYKVNNDFSLSVRSNAE